MKRKRLLLGIILSLAMILLPAMNAFGIEIITRTDIIKEVVLVDDLVKMADNAIILMNSSSSMKKEYMDTGKSRYQVAVEMLRERNALPDLGFNVGLYNMTPWTPLFPVQPYNQEALAAAIDSLPSKAGGPTELRSALHKLRGILDGLSGRTAVFFFTDGTPEPKSEGFKSPRTIAKELADNYDVCFYIISTADDAASRGLVNQVAKMNFCSRVIPFSAFIERPEYNSGALYVVKPDVDVITTAETRIVGIKLDPILFDFNKSEARPEFKSEIDRLGKFMQQTPDSFALIAGFTDSKGSEDYNFGLSFERAAGVAEYLDMNFGIGPERLVVLWYGERNPAASNDTEEGRAMNRRVEIAVGGIE
jgi:OOP family OmpA-OmpF porin